MATKTTGAELKRFYTDPKWWKDLAEGETGMTPDNEYNYTWHDDEYITVDGQNYDDCSLDISELPDDAIVTVDGGIVFGPVVGSKEPTFEGYFKRWRKAQTVQFVVVEIENERLDELLAAVKNLGGKVKK